MDVLALDEDGEIVLIELKVSENFRVTDLQALAYAGAYATQDPSDLARTLGRYLEKVEKAAATLTATTGIPSSSTADSTAFEVGASSDSGPDSTSNAPVSDDVARQRIAEFLKLEEFDAWQPSQHVRVKLVAPSFPRRVLKTVNWLGDVYDMPIEAIAVRLFGNGDGPFHLTFERLLPLPGEEQFDMTVRRREERKRAENTTKRPDVVPFLLEHGLLEHGHRLWLRKESLFAKDRHLYDPENVVFQVTVHSVSGMPVKFAWAPDETSKVEFLAPSAVSYRVCRAVADYEGSEFKTAVAPTFAIKPNGRSLEEVATEDAGW